MENKYDIYICYSRKDLDYAHAITRIIESGGYSYFFDYNGIYSGDDFAMRINDAIERCALFVFLLSENTNQSRWSLTELSTAIGLGKTILPIQIDDSSAEGRIKFMLGEYQRLKYVNLPGFENKLLERIASILGENDYETITAQSNAKKISQAKPTVQERPVKPTAVDAPLQEPQTIHDLEVKLESIGIDSTVVHKKFGKGTVVKINKNEKFIHIKFTLGEKKFVFPDAFLMGFLEVE